MVEQINIENQLYYLVKRYAIHGTYNNGAIDGIGNTL